MSPILETVSEFATEPYAATFDEVEKRHARLIGGLTAEQVETLIDMVNYLDARIPLMGSEAEPFDVDLMSIRQK
jgi:hypothetical protein